jgi:PAS domain S-box-containing protein
MKKSSFFILSILLLLSNSVHAHVHAPTSTRTITLQLPWKHQFEFAGYYAAIAQGFYAQRGLRVELLEYSEGLNVTDEVVSGRADYGITHSDVVEARLYGKPVVLLANYFKKMPLALLTRPEIKNLAQLRGKRLMISSKDAHSPLFKLALEMEGLEVGKHLELVPHSFNADPFLRGDIDAMSAFITNEPFYLKQAGIEFNILPLGDYMRSLGDLYLFTTTQHAYTYAHQTQDLIDATNEGWRYALEHKEEIVDLILAHYSQRKSRDALLYEAEKTHDMILPLPLPIGSIFEDMITDTAKLIMRQQKIPDKGYLKGFIFDFEHSEQYIQLTTEEREWLQQHPTLRYCFNPVWNPYDFLAQNQHQGIFKDYLDVLALKLGVTFVPVPSNVEPQHKGRGWPKALQLAQERECDFISGAVRTFEREAYLNFTQPYFDITQVLIATTDKTFVPSLDTLNHETMGIHPGAAFKETLQRDYPSIKIVEIETDNIAHALDSGEIYAFISSLEHIVYWMNEQIHNYKIIGKIDYPYPISVAVRNDWPQLYVIMNKAIAALTQTEHNEIQRRWLTHTLEQKIDYRQLWHIAGIILCIFVLILYWNRTLRREVARRRLVEQALQMSEQRLRAIIAAEPECIKILDQDGHLQQMNPAGLAMIEADSQEQVIGRCVFEIVAPEYRAAYVQLHQNVMAGTAQQLEYEILGLKGRRRWLDSHAVCLNDNGKKLHLAVTRDISRRKQIEADLIRARQAAEAANHAKSAFLANMSHELRTPLNVVLGFAQILNADIRLTPNQHKQLQSIQRSGEYLLTLINDVLDLAKIEAGHFELFPNDWDTYSFFQEFNYMFKMRAEQKNLFFRYEKAPSLPAALHCDDKRLRQILMNLLSNAFKFTESGGVILRVRYCNEHLCLEVEDSGIGISVTEVDKIFEPFYQSGTEHYKNQGTGLGLSISRRLVQAMGGHLEVRSHNRQGSVFYVDIPAAAVFLTTPIDTPAPLIQGYSRIPPTDEAVRILICDDNADNCEILCDLLQPLGFALTQVDSGIACLNTVAQWQPDLILIDIYMTDIDGLNGLETTRRLRAHSSYAALPIIAFSACSFMEDQEASLNAGCQAYLSKPIKFNLLLDAIARFLPLEWIHSVNSTNITPQIENDEHLSPTQIKILLKQARTGDITQLISSLQTLQHSSECPASVTTLLELARGFKLKEIKNILKQWETHALSDKNH